MEAIMVRKINFILLTVLIILLMGCSNTESQTALEQIAESGMFSEVNEELRAEERAIEIFKEIKAKIEADDGEKATGGKELEDLAKAYPDNKTINTFYYFDSANFWLHKAEKKTTADDYYVRFEENLSLIDINFDGEYSDFIKSYIETNMGSKRYNQLHKDAVERKAGFDNMTEDEKVAILVYIHSEEEKYGDSITEEKSELIWTDACNKFGISESNIMDLMMDTTIVKKSYSSSNASESVDKPAEQSITVYDATLENDGYKVTVAATKDFMSEYVDAIARDDKTAINDMFYSGYISYVKSGTKANISDLGVAVSKVKILEGSLKGLEVYTINECVVNR